MTITTTNAMDELRAAVIAAVQGTYPDRETLRDLHFELGITKPHFDRLVRSTEKIREAFSTGNGWDRDQARQLVDPELADGISALTTKLSGVRSRQEECQKVIGEFLRHKLKPGKYDTLRPQTRPTPKQLLSQNLRAAEYEIAQNGSYQRASVVEQRDMARRGLKKIEAAENELVELCERVSEIEGEIAALRLRQEDWRNFRL